jgi:hypothetical protein
MALSFLVVRARLPQERLFLESLDCGGDGREHPPRELALTRDVSPGSRYVD